MLTLAQAVSSVIIGLIQGISEWLPISSKTQILVASQYLLGLTFSQAYTFGLFMEIGTIIAAVIYFRRELASLVRVLLGSKDDTSRKLFVYVLVTTIVTGIIGAPLYFIADSITGISVGIPMLIIGVVLLFDAFFIRYSRSRLAKSANTRKFSDLGVRDYVLLGVAQGIAALPGVSRSGITTSSLLILNVEADEAFRLSFIAGIFAAAAAFALTVLVSKANVAAALTGIGAAGLSIAILTSTIVSLFLIDFLIKIAGKSKIVYLTGALGAIAFAGGLMYLIFGL